MPSASGVVIGGSPRFVTALIVRLASESGQWPEVAADAEQAISLARQDAWLLVLELQDEALAPRVRELRQERGSSLAIVVAAPPGSGSASLLERSADAVVTLDGVPAGVLEVVRRVAAARRPPATVPGPAAAPAPPEPAPKPASGELPVEPRAAFSSSSVWPGTVLPPEEARSVLMGAVAGLWPSEAFRLLTERVVASLSEVEKRALRGDAIAVEPAPICRAAAMRLVVTAALEGAPAAGGAVDGASVRAILGEIDAALVDLKRVGERAAPAVQPELESVRHVLVKEAIDLTDAVHRIVPSEAPPEPVAQTPTPRPLRQEAGKKRRHRVLWLLLAIAAAGGAALQGYVYLLRTHR